MTSMTGVRGKETACAQCINGLMPDPSSFIEPPSRRGRTGQHEIRNESAEKRTFELLDLFQIGTVIRRRLGLLAVVSQVCL